MKRRARSSLEGWEIEILDAAMNQVRGNQDMLEYLSEGGRVVDDDVGDITDDEWRKAQWKLAHYRAELARLEFDLANDNSPARDVELSDLIEGEWY